MSEENSRESMEFDVVIVGGGPAGLAAAIPAVVAFNYFTQRVTGLRAEMDIFATDFLSMVVRQFFKKPTPRKGAL